MHKLNTERESVYVYVGGRNLVSTLDVDDKQIS